MYGSCLPQQSGGLVAQGESFGWCNGGESLLLSFRLSSLFSLRKRPCSGSLPILLDGVFSCDWLTLTLT
jgi:hypothetical protein